MSKTIDSHILRIWFSCCGLLSTKNIAEQYFFSPSEFPDIFLIYLEILAAKLTLLPEKRTFIGEVAVLLTSLSAQNVRGSAIKRLNFFMIFPAVSTIYKKLENFLLQKWQFKNFYCIFW